jgi:integrase
MMKKFFDDPTIRNLKPTDKLYACKADKEPGFGIRVYPSGTKTFFYQYKIHLQRRFMTLGDYPTTSLKTAREQYQAEASKVKALRRGSKDGADPVLEIKRERERRITEEAEHRKAPTVEELAQEYIEKHAKKFKRSWQKDERILNHDVVEVWGKRKAHDITKRDVNLLLEGIVERNAPAMANNCFQIIRKMFNWAIEKDILQHTPCTGVKLPAPKLSRERVLSEDETRTLWANLDRTDLSITDSVRRALRLILVTAQRPGEVIGMHTNEIDGNWWTIPSERSKNGKTQRVYLTTTALELIGDTTGKVYIFPTPHKAKEQPIGDTALAVAVGRNLAMPIFDSKGKPLYAADGKQATENLLGIEHFTPHDLRRTAATFMSNIGFMDEIIDAILNHSKKGVIKVYNLNKYDKEKQQALEAWERKLLSITTDRENNVIPMRRKIA